MLFFVGCSSSEQPGKICLNKDSLNASFTAEANSVIYKGTSAWDGEKIVFSVSEPEKLNGVKFVFRGNELSCSYGENDFIYPYSDFSNDFVLLRLAQKLNPVDGEILQKKSGGEYEYNFDGDVFTADSRGNLISFKTKNGIIYFTNRQ